MSRPEAGAVGGSLRAPGGACVFERAALRWIGRYCLERRDLTIEDVRDVAEAFARMRDDGESAAATLRRLSSR